jgi:hypothetical protein
MLRRKSRIVSMLELGFSSLFDDWQRFRGMDLLCFAGLVWRLMAIIASLVFLLGGTNGFCFFFFICFVSEWVHGAESRNDGREVEVSCTCFVHSLHTVYQLALDLCWAHYTGSYSYRILLFGLRLVSVCILIFMFKPLCCYCCYYFTFSALRIY